MKLIRKIFRKLLLSWSAPFNTRVMIILGILTGYIGYIFYCTYQTTVVDRSHYVQRINSLKRDSVPVNQLRGVIYSEAGQMIAASLPEYDVFFDFRGLKTTTAKVVVDTLPNGLTQSRKIPLLPLDTVNYYFSATGPAAQYMHKLRPDKTAAQHAADFKAAYQRGDSRYLAMRRVSYLERKEMQDEAPFFSKNVNHIGLFFEERPHRYRPYGNTRMASSTIGGVISTDQYMEVDGRKVNRKGHGLNGLELTFDSLLCGEPGIGFVEKVHNKSTTVVQREPIDGADIYTTLDMEMQQILDYELNKRILELGAVGGWAAVMEVKTGKIKAISNLSRRGNVCAEDYNHFVSDIGDPGSTFKTVSYMVMLDDEKITPETRVNTNNTREHHQNWNYHGKEIRDDHPVGEVTAHQAIEQSSNIAIAKLTTQAYDSDPQRYLDLIYKTRIFDDLHLNVEFQGAQRTRKRKVGDEGWSKVSLAQISYGYETQIPGMYILNFYNAIANGGKLMRPYIVNRAVKDGKVVYEREPEVINSSICKKSTLEAIRRSLEGVVINGTARAARSQKVTFAGKTGTAQRYANGSYYGNGHNASFAGYFPADDPQYTCVVVINVPPHGNFGNPGGGYMAGPVFRNFAEQIYARDHNRKLNEVTPDSASVANVGMYPRAKRGPEDVTLDVINSLNLADHGDNLHVRSVNINNVTQGAVPNVEGMGAADALYMLESVGLRVNIIGRGKVYSQSMAGGTACKRGQTITIMLR